jgi:hypothetical protein
LWWSALALLSWPAPSTVAAAAQETAWPAVVTALQGEWQGEGTLFGNPATFTMEWSAALGDRFVRLRFSNALVNEGGSSPIISAEAFYRVAADGGLEGHWFDTRGYVLTLSARVTDDRIVTDWAAAGVESGRTTYRMIDADTVEVIDEVSREGELQEFGRATYRRAPRPAGTTAGR